MKGNVGGIYVLDPLGNEVVTTKDDICSESGEVSDSFITRLGDLKLDSREKVGLESSKAVRNMIDDFYDTLDLLEAKSPKRKIDGATCINYSEIEDQEGSKSRVAEGHVERKVKQSSKLIRAEWDSNASISEKMDRIADDIGNLYKLLEVERRENKNCIKRLEEMVKHECNEKEALSNKLVKLQDSFKNMRENYICVVSETASELKTRCDSKLVCSVDELNNRLMKISREFNERIRCLERVMDNTVGVDIVGKMMPGIQVVREAPKLSIFSGKSCNGKAVKRWLKKVEECVNVLGLKGVAAVQYIKNSLEDPALTRVRLAKPKDMSELCEVLLDAYGEKQSVTDLKYELWGRRQAIGEDVWEYADAISELDEELQTKEERSPRERDNMKCKVFAKGLKDEAMREKVRKKIEKGEIKCIEEAVKFVRERSKQEISTSIIREPSKFVGRCWHCGEMGHIAKLCREAWTGYHTEDRDVEMGNRYARENGLQQSYEQTGNRAEGNDYERVRIKGACWNCHQIGHPMSQSPYGYKIYEGEKKYNTYENRDRVVRSMGDECTQVEQGN